MKIENHILDSRNSLLAAVRQISEIPEDKQGYALLTINAALNEIDNLKKLTKVVENAKKDEEQELLFDLLKSKAKFEEIWPSIEEKPFADYKLMVLRLEPEIIKGVKISGYLKTYHLPTTIPDIIEEVGKIWGGGRFQVRIIDAHGKYIKSKTFEISGLPKIPERDK